MVKSLTEVFSRSPRLIEAAMRRLQSRVEVMLEGAGGDPEAALGAADEEAIADPDLAPVVGALGLEDAPGHAVDAHHPP